MKNTFSRWTKGFDCKGAYSILESLSRKVLKNRNNLVFGYILMGKPDKNKPPKIQASAPQTSNSAVQSSSNGPVAPQASNMTKSLFENIHILNSSYLMKRNPPFLDDFFFNKSFPSFFFLSSF
jgi:hypothetical protein